jgi:hypothetical protein
MADKLSGLPAEALAKVGGKSGLHGTTVPDNVRRARERSLAQGKCHRKQVAPGFGPNLRRRDSERVG